MPSFSRLALAFSCIALPLSASISSIAWAAEQKKPVTDCMSLLQQAGTIETGPDSKIEPIADGCHAANIHVSQSKYTRWRVADARITGKDLLESIGAGRMPETLDVSLKGAAVDIDIGSPALRYSNEVMQMPYDVHLAYRWDGTSHDLVFDDFSVKAPPLGEMSFSAAVANVGEMPKVAGPTAFALAITSVRSLSAHVDNHGLFEKMVVPVIIARLPRDKDPRPAITGLQQTAISFVEALPEAVAPAESKTALKSFIGEFPHPSGLYHVDIKPKHPVPGIEIIDAAKEPQVLSGLLEKLTIAANHPAVAQ